MKCSDIIKYIENWAPKDIAWERDNIGLQVGNSSRRITNIMLSLELNEKVLKQAVNKNCNFIITHHPLLFRPLKHIDTEKDPAAKLVEKLIKKDITLYSAHTNLDFTKDGVSFALARKLLLKNIKFLKNIPGKLFKLVVFVPENSISKVADAIHLKGGGIIGNYSHCSFRTKGMGTYKGSQESNPTIGEKGHLESVDEIRLEVMVDSWKIKNVITALLSVHPYEEVAYDIYPVLNDNVNYGMGVIGELENPMNRNLFLSHVCDSLITGNLRYAEGKSRSIRKVAVCGGSCSDLLEIAIASGVDAFITADIKYHSFQDAAGRILFIDAGHYETEIHSIIEVQKKLNHFIDKNSGIKVYKYNGSTNPVIFYNN
jgi:dinuclear metal center YbgI/SA1388 family protein